MKLKLSRMGLVAVLIASSAACIVVEEVEVIEPASDTGQFKAPLRTTTDSGIMYRLRPGTQFLIQRDSGREGGSTIGREGDGNTRVNIAAEPGMREGDIVLTVGGDDVSFLEERLAVGRYTISLVEGWALQVRTDLTTFETVETELLSPSINFTIVGMETTEVTFDFRVDEEVVAMGSGNVRVNFDVQETEAIQAVVTGSQRTCIFTNNGRLKCWGQNASGSLGLGSSGSVGFNPEQLGEALPFVDLGADNTVAQLAMGSQHTCALLDSGDVKCWGAGGSGRLGLGNTTNIGGAPGEMGDALAFVPLGDGRTALQLSTGSQHTCALLDNNDLKCWGSGQFGKLGQTSTASLGNQPSSTPDNIPAVDLGAGRFAIQVAAGGQHTCALLDNNTVKCWGRNNNGQLGQGNMETISDTPGEMGDALSPVDLGAGRIAVQVVVGGVHTCALLDNGEVKCRGSGAVGRLGLGNTANIGDAPGEMGDDLPTLPLGRSVVELTAGDAHTCALLDNNTVKCWGFGGFGRLGQGNTDSVGDQVGEVEALAAVDIGTDRYVIGIDANHSHTCVHLDNGEVKCWGYGNGGALGIGSQSTIGDEANEMGDALMPALISL